MSKQLLIFLSLLFAIATSASTSTEIPRFLSGYGAKRSKIGVSGLSAGAFMAVQLHIAFSKKISGAGLLAGGLYYCAEGEVNTATKKCMKGSPQLSATRTKKFIQNFYRKGLIDSPTNLKDDNVYLFSGKSDILVNQRGMKQLEEMYALFMPKRKIKSIWNFNAGHGMPTLNRGTTCLHDKYFNAPWILNCNYDAAGEILKNIHGKLHSPIKAISSNLKMFDQTEFGAIAGTSLLPFGYIYIPTDCRERKKSCRIHVALHGCDQDPVTVGKAYVRDSGYNEWAESNDIIIVYPSAMKSIAFPQNPLGCFDWWGYTGQKYATKEGVQMKFINRILNRLAE